MNDGKIIKNNFNNQPHTEFTDINPNYPITNFNIKSVADFDLDGHMDYFIFRNGYGIPPLSIINNEIYLISKNIKIWSSQNIDSFTSGLFGYVVGDVNNDCVVDCIYLDNMGRVNIVDIESGNPQYQIQLDSISNKEEYYLTCYDIDGDDNKEIIVSTAKEIRCYDEQNGYLYWKFDKSELPFLPNYSGSTQTPFITILDPNFDGNPFIYFAYQNKFVKINAINGVISLVKDFKYPFDLRVNYFQYSGDFDNSNFEPEIIGVGYMIDSLNNSHSLIYCLNSNLDSIWTIPISNGMWGPLIMTDYNNDGCSELIFDSGSMLFAYGFPNSAPCGTLRSPIQADFCVSSLNICTGDCITLVDHSSGYPAEWEWDFEGSNHPKIGGNYVQRVCYPHPGEFTISMKASNSGYESTAQKKISVAPGPDYLFEMPNVLTPNGDGVNDVLNLNINSGAIQNFKFNIINRWGNLVFHSDQASFTWNPTSLNPGVYYWLMEYDNECNGTKAQKKKGIITLLDK